LRLARKVAMIDQIFVPATAGRKNDHTYRLIKTCLFGVST